MAASYKPLRIIGAAEAKTTDTHMTVSSRAMVMAIVVLMDISNTRTTAKMISAPKAMSMSPKRLPDLLGAAQPLA